MTQDIQILVLTALEVERQAVVTHLQNGRMDHHQETGSDYYLGTFSIEGKTIEVAVARTDQTNVNAAMETERAIQYYNPQYVFFVGIAGGLKDVAVGDIVIGSEVLGYERGKATDEEFKFRPQFGASSYSLERMAAAYALSEAWKLIEARHLDSTFSPQIKVLTGTIASGEKVDAGHASPLHQHIRQNASHALAIEMEGLGFLRVCMTRPGIKSLLLRGISDLVSDKGEMDGKGSQPYASQNVAAFLFGLLGQLEIDFMNKNQQPKPDLFEVLCKLYPRGVEDQGIWVRSGGDLASLNLNTPGKGEWAEAVRLLRNGGGGQITFGKLYKAIKEDFPGNKGLEGLALIAEPQKHTHSNGMHPKPPLPPLAQARKHIEEGKPVDAIDDIRIHLQHAELSAADTRGIDNVLTMKMGVLNDLKMKSMKGLMADGDLIRQKNQVNFDLLQIIDELEEA